VKFFSGIDLLTNLKNMQTVAEWTLLPALKAGMIKTLQSLSETAGSADFLSVTTLTDGVLIAGEFTALAAAAENPVLLTTIPFATAIDAGVRQMCSDVPGLRF
jgi:hypothetical protein